MNIGLPGTGLNPDPGSRRVEVTVENPDELRPRRKSQDNSSLRARAADAEKRDSGHPDLELTDIVRDRAKDAKSRRRGWFRRKG